MPLRDRRSTVTGMHPTGARARRRSILLLGAGAASATGALTACAGEADTPDTTTAVPDGERLRQYPPVLEVGDNGGLAWSPKGDVLAATGTGQLALYPAAMATGGGGEPTVRKAHGGKDVTAPTWSPDGTRIATFGYDETIQLVPGKAFAQIRDLTWAADGRSFYAASHDAVRRMPDAAGEPLVTLRDSDMSEWWAMAVAPDGRVVIASHRKGAGDGEKDVLRVYPADLAKPGPGFEIPEPCDDVTTIRFSSDGRRIAVRFDDGPICVWAVTGVKGRLVGVYREHDRREALDNLAWQPGTDRVASLIPTTASTSGARAPDSPAARGQAGGPGGPATAGRGPRGGPAASLRPGRPRAAW
jgi:WD40 repeat protein